MTGGEHHRVAVIGAGFGGLAAAGRLRDAGERDVVVLERGDRVGGTWRDNTYPGCACDVPSHLYSLSFAPNPHWSRSFSGQAEIQHYLEQAARDHDLLDHVRLGTDVHSAAWDEQRRRWVLHAGDAELTADVLVDGSGALAEPTLPDLPGLARFEGTVFHSARWNHDHDLTGRRVAVIGTGASAIQFVPAIAARTARLLVVQRTAPWVIPRLDRPTSSLERRVLALAPALQRAMRAGQYHGRDTFLYPVTWSRTVRRVMQALSRAHLRRAVRDRELRRTLTPTFEIGCKRILISNDWYPALAREDVDLATGVREVRAHSIVTDDGTEHPVDTIIAGTGFEVVHPPIAERIHGREGFSLAQAWAGRPASLHATTIAGFPNLFRLGGPGTITGHTSHVSQIEAQLSYVVDALAVMDAQRADVVEPTREAQASDVAALRKDLRTSVWTVGGCKSWYQDDAGVASTTWPRSARRFRSELSRFDPAAYALSGGDDLGADPLVLISGVGATALEWTPVLGLLRAGGRTPVCVELPGHGAAPPLGREPSIDALADAVQARLDVLGLERAAVAGSSLGGWVALELARRGRAASVVALTPPGLWSAAGERFARTSVTASAALVRRIDPLLEEIMHSPAGRTATLGQFLGRPWRLTPHQAVGAARALAFEPGVAPAVHAMRGARLAPLATDVPVTVAWGTRDRLLGAMPRDRLTAILPGARLETLPGCGHLPMADDPERTAQVLLAGSPPHAAVRRTERAVAAA